MTTQPAPGHDRPALVYHRGRLTTPTAHNPKRILLIRPSALGDVCRTVPVLARLRERFPGARIDWLVQEGFEPAIADHPALLVHSGGPILFPRQRFRRWASPPTLADVLRWMNRLRDGRYDLVIDAQGLFRSGLFAWWTRAPIRIGHADAAELAWLGCNRRVRTSHDLHTVDRMMALADAACGDSTRRPSPESLRLYTNPNDRDWLTAQAWLAGNPRPRFAVVAPTSRWPGKLWPAERHAAVARALLDDTSANLRTVVLVGSDSERGQCGPLLDLAQDDRRVIDLLGGTTVGQLMAVVEGSSLVIGSDSAALHMAVGFDRPLVGLYGPTRVDLVGPYGRERDVVQHIAPSDRLDHKDERSGRELMARISADEVIAAARQRLS
ncbi:MAG: glycosyltransferase family 9 protein [Phycisphaeraceae bacterium]|nr:glycosyltransferase family 9 protein [Phycisphaeraceae bacterium]